MSKRIVKLIQDSNYSEREFQALYSLYKYRCLSFDQIYSLHYSKSKLGTRDVDTGYMRRRMAQFKKDGLIEKMTKIEKDCPPLFSLTTDGIKVVRTYFNLSVDDEKENDIFTTNLTYAEIKVDPKFSFHQFYLNCFAMNLNKMFAQVNDYMYVDERHMNKSRNIRPDGLCVINRQKVVIDGQEHIIPETHFFLENDMGTETLAKIRQKFERYRAFLESSKNDNNIRIVVLFICKDSKLTPEECTDNIVSKNYQESASMKRRIKNIKKAISEAMLDLVKDNVEVFVGTQPKLLAAIKCHYLPEYFGMNKKSLLPDVASVLARFQDKLDFKDVNKVAKFTNDVVYDYYAKSDVYHKSFIFLEYFGDPMSVIHKLTYHKKNSLSFRQNMHRELNLVIIANKEENLSALNEICELSNPKFDAIMVTTVSRLKKYDFEQALFKFTSYGTAVYKDNFRTLVPDNTIV